MMLATFIDDLERLHGMGLPMVGCILLLFLLALAAVIGSGFALFWKFAMGERKRHDALLNVRDAERKAEKEEFDERLSQSEQRHEACESDRHELRKELHAVELKVARITSCPKSGCPMRLPG